MIAMSSRNQLAMAMGFYADLGFIFIISCIYEGVIKYLMLSFFLFFFIFLFLFFYV